MEDDILIDNYFKGLLSEDEEKSFMERLSNDASFDEKFRLEEQLINALNEDSWSFVKVTNEEVEAYSDLFKNEELQRLKKTLSETNSKLKAKKKGSTERLFYYLAAACIVVFLMLKLFFNQNVSNQELYNDYIALNDLPSFVSRSDESSQLVKAQEFFVNKKYAEALLIFESLDDSDDFISKVLIYKGISETELGQYNDAQETFDSLINSNLFDAQTGYWYKALLFLKQDRVEEVKSILNKIIEEDLFKNEEAKELINKIK